jgi:transcription elongation factor Elf1
MKDDLQDRMADPPRRRGRPPLVEQLARHACPEVQPGSQPLTFRCPACGAESLMRVYRKTDEDHRAVRCGKCGRSFNLWVTDIKRLVMQSSRVS